MKRIIQRKILEFAYRGFVSCQLAVYLSSVHVEVSGVRFRLLLSSSL